MSSPPSRPIVFASLAVALVAISSAALLVRLSASPPLAIAFWRLLDATVLLAPGALAPAVRRELGSVTRRDVLVLGATGIILAVHFATWIASIAPSAPYATTVVASTVLVTTHPVVVGLATPFVLRERVPGRGWIGILLALLGAAFIALADARGGTHRWLGDALALAGAAAGALYLLAGRRVRARFGLIAYVLPTYAAATVALGLAAVAMHQSLYVTSWHEHAIFLLLALGPMVLGHTVFNWLLAYVPAWVVSTTILAEPVVATLLVWLFRGEVPPARVLPGAVIVLVGIFLTAAPSRRAPATPIADAGRARDAGTTSANHPAHTGEVER